jgi:hypothetical protein
MNYSARRTARPFASASATAFFERFPFVSRENEVLVREILASINTPQALAEMLQSLEAGEPPYAGVGHRIDGHLAELRARAEHDANARARLNRLTSISGSLIREVLEANGYRKHGRPLAMPAHLRHIAKEAAMYRAA